jgi:hypothetical protein
MATWNWGPIKCTQEHTECKVEYNLKYYTVSDSMSLYRKFLDHGIYYNEKTKLNEEECVFSADYGEYDASCRLIIKCFLEYTMGYDAEMVDKLLSHKAMIVDRPEEPDNRTIVNIDDIKPLMGHSKPFSDSEWGDWELVMDEDCGCKVYARLRRIRLNVINPELRPLQDNVQYREENNPSCREHK